MDFKQLNEGKVSVKGRKGKGKIPAKEVVDPDDMVSLNPQSSDDDLDHDTHEESELINETNSATLDSDSMNENSGDTLDVPKKGKSRDETPEDMDRRVERMVGKCMKKMQKRSKRKKTKRARRRYSSSDSSSDSTGTESSESDSGSYSGESTDEEERRRSRKRKRSTKKKHKKEKRRRNRRGESTKDRLANDGLNPQSESMSTIYTRGWKSPSHYNRKLSDQTSATDSQQSGHI